MLRKFVTALLGIFGALGLILWAQNYIQTNPSIAQAVTGYLTIQSNGSAITQRNTVNFISGANSTVSCVDDSGNSRSNCTVSSTGGGSGLSRSGFFLTDGSNFYIGPQINLATLPVLGSFSYLTAQGTASAATVGNAVVFTAPTTATDIVRCFGQAISTNTTLTVAFSTASNNQNFVAGGLAFYESASGKLLTYVVSMTPSDSPGRFALIAQHWNSSTSFGAPVLGLGNGSDVGDTRWYQLQITGGNLNLRYSMDGVNFSTVYTEAVNSFFTTAPDNWCLAANTNTSGSAGSVTVTNYSWLAQ